VLELEDGFVYSRDGVKDYLQKVKDDTSGRSARANQANPTISMTITINNVDQELCGHFLWDLAHKAIRDKFKFDLDAASSNGVLHRAIAVDEFEAHYTIVTRAFEYLGEEDRDQTRDIGRYLVCWLPHHLNQLWKLRDDVHGVLMPDEQLKIGQNLYRLFKDEDVFQRHRASFEQTYWTVDEMESMQKWFMDWSVMRGLDTKWRDKVQHAPNPMKGFMSGLVRMVVQGFLRERSWEVQNAYCWISEFVKIVSSFLLSNRLFNTRPRKENMTLTICRELGCQIRY
jgi:hypothetical protein